MRTSTCRYNFKGITRAKVLAACREAGLRAEEGDFSLAEVYDADEAFVTARSAAWPRFPPSTAGRLPHRCRDR